MDAPAEDAGARVEDVQATPASDEIGHEFLSKVGRTVAVDRDIDMNAAARRLHQHGLQFAPDLVVEPDEGLEQHLAFGPADRIEHARERIPRRFPAGGSGCLRCQRISGS